MLLKEIKNVYHKELDKIYPKEEVDSFFAMLIAHYLGLERFILVMQPNLVISKLEEGPLFEALAQLRLHRPIQYIIGTSHFMDMDFFVNENVLIPRPETEELVRWIIEDNSSVETYAHNRRPTILDVGTGSGCIAVALAKNMPNFSVHALDVSDDALEMARANIKLNKTDVVLKQADIFDTEDAIVPYQIIVSNPPYVRMQERMKMGRNVTEYEPELALFVSDENPLIYYKAIAKFAKKNLVKKGCLYIEINQYLAKETEQLLKDDNFSEIELRKDLFGNDRIMKASI